MQFVMVNADPLVSSAAFCATRVENNGESATTTMPQKKRNAIRSEVELPDRKIGEEMQHKHEKSRARVAMRLGPNRSENRPPSTHAGPPAAMITKESRGMLKSANCAPKVASITGTNAQNV